MQEIFVPVIFHVTIGKVSLTRKGGVFLTLEIIVMAAILIIQLFYLIKLERMEKYYREESEKNRELYRQSERESRAELLQALRQFENATGERLDKTTQVMTGRHDHIIKITEHKLEHLREVVEGKISDLQKDNNEKLEKIRETVDEKLHKTLEHRLGESFKQVSSRLEQVHQGLGEMQNLANGVGDLKKVLSNVKTRGVLGEYQLESLLEQLLTPEQYEKNVAVQEDSADRVEFAVKLPGSDSKAKPVWMPIDAKFPTETYQHLLDAYENGESEMIDSRRKSLINRIKADARMINQKYLAPPYTTDFAIMFLPFEGLYAEVLRLGIFEEVQREFKVTIAGPTTLSALLNSLQMGFRTLAIQKRSSEVWELLGAVKSEFGKFGGILDKTRKKLQEASNVIDKAGVRTRAIERRLREVEEMPSETTLQWFEDEKISDELQDEEV